MESLERSESVIELGKKIVTSIQLGHDPAAQWMAHLLAEKIEAAETQAGKDKSSAVEGCLDIIVQLWERRYGLPAYVLPMRELDPLLGTLRSLEVGEGASLRYIAQRPSEAELKCATEAEKELFELALEVDNSARELVRYLISAAAERSVSAINPWLEDAAKVGLEVSMERLLSDFVSDVDKEKKSILDRADRLESFAAIALSYASDLRGQLKDVEDL